VRPVRTLGETPRTFSYHPKIRSRGKGGDRRGRGFGSSLCNFRNERRRGADWQKKMNIKKRFVTVWSPQRGGEIEERGDSSAPKKRRSRNFVPASEKAPLPCVLRRVGPCIEAERKANLKRERNLAKQNEEKRGKNRLRRVKVREDAAERKAPFTQEENT